MFLWLFRIWVTFEEELLMRRGSYKFKLKTQDQSSDHMIHYSSSQAGHVLLQCMSSVPVVCAELCCDIHPSIEYWSIHCRSIIRLGLSFASLAAEKKHNDDSFDCKQLFIYAHHIFGHSFSHRSIDRRPFIQSNDPSINLLKYTSRTRLTWIRLMPLCKSITCPACPDCDPMKTEAEDQRRPSKGITISVEMGFLCWLLLLLWYRIRQRDYMGDKS